MAFIALAGLGVGGGASFLAYNGGKAAGAAWNGLDQSVKNHIIGRVLEFAIDQLHSTASPEALAPLGATHGSDGIPQIEIPTLNRPNYIERYID